MLTMKPLLAAALAACCCAPASAQLRVAEPASPKQEGVVRVQTSIGFFLAGPTGEGEEAVKLRERARRIVYDVAGRECDIAKEAFAMDCRLESVNSSINLQRTYPGQQQQEGYSVNGSMTLQLTVK